MGKRVTPVGSFGRTIDALIHGWAAATGNRATAEAFGAAVKAAEPAADCSGPTIRRMLRGEWRGPEATLRAIERFAGLPAGALDPERATPAVARQARWRAPGTRYQVSREELDELFRAAQEQVTSGRLGLLFLDEAPDQRQALVRLLVAQALVDR